ncbi:TonB-dependent receptor [Reichenbachiella sp. MALMAid0571]|uniref:TonB-dependent receptor n=1 Tax=Reichenbachiella sp. MALMAid0571 TaxID=3143939 RepID=UPI0032DE4755
MARVYCYMLTLVFIQSVSVLSIMAQTKDCSYTLSGQITDEHDQSPLEYSSIYIKELERGVTADERGNYMLSNLCAGTYSVLIRHVGCKPKEEFITIKKNTVKEFSLEHHPTELNEVIVEGELEEADVSLTTSELSEIQLDQSRGKTLGESLKSLSGVNSLQSGPTISKPVINGLHSNRILIMNNGIRQEGQQWGQEHAPEIDPFSATGFKVIKGAATVRYGADAIGGIVLVEPPSLLSNREFKGSISMIGQSNNRQGVVSAMMEKGYDNGIGWRVQGSAKKGGDAKASNYNLSNTGVQEINFSGAFGLTKEHYGFEGYLSHFDSDIAILRSAHIGNLTDLTNAINSDVPLYVEDFTYTIDNPRQEVRHDLMKLNGFLKLADLGTVRLQYGFQSNHRNEYDRRRGANFNRPSISLDIFTHTLDLVFEQHALGKLKGEFGASSIYQRNKNNTGTNANFLIPDYKNYGLGAFAIEKYVQQKWELEAGIRYDFRQLNPFVFDSSNKLLSPKYTFNNVTASVGGDFSLNEKLTLKANIASAWRPPQVSELFSNGLHHGAAAIEQGLLYPGGFLSENLLDADIQSEQAIKAIATMEYKSNNLLVEGSIYHNTINNYIYLRPDGIRLSIRGAFPVFQYMRTNARFVGMDAVVKYKLSNQWSYNAKVSLLRAKDVSADDVLINIPANSFENGITYQMINIPDVNKVYFTLDVLTVMHQGRAPQAFLDFENSEPPSSIYDFKTAPDGYTLLNFHSGVEFDKLKLGFSVENLLNISYRDYMNRFRYFTDDIGINYSLRLFYNF